MPPLTLALLLALGPAESEQDPSTAPLEQAIVSASPTADSVEQLSAALAIAEAEGLDLADDRNALELLDRARLALVSVHLALGESAEAEAAMDEVIRSAMGREVEAGTFGPEVLALYERRLQSLQEAGKSSIAVECDGCELIVNEARVGETQAQLYLGRYRVWVVFPDPARPPERFEIELREPGAVERRSFASLTEPSRTEHVRPQQQKKSARARLLPRWAELAAVSVGAALLTGGVALAALHGKCRGDAFGGDVSDGGACPRLYSNRPQDGILIGVGASVMIAAGVVLSVDEVRVGRQRDRRAMLTWTTRF